MPNPAPEGDGLGDAQQDARHQPEAGSCQRDDQHPGLLVIATGRQRGRCRGRRPTESGDEDGCQQEPTPAEFPARTP